MNGCEIAKGGTGSTPNDPWTHVTIMSVARDGAKNRNPLRGLLQRYFRTSGCGQLRRFLL